MLSLTIGVIGAKEGVLVMAEPEVVPFNSAPFCFGGILLDEKCGWDGGEKQATSG